MPTATIYRDGKAIHTTTLTASQGEDFRTLADAVRQAQAVLQFDPATPGASSLSGVDNFHGASIYEVLPRLAELIGGSVTSIADEYPWLWQSVHSQHEDSFRPFWKNIKAVPKTHRATALVSQATALGMLPTDGLKFDYAELTDTGPAAVAESGGAKVGGSGVPMIRASVRWR